MKVILFFLGFFVAVQAQYNMINYLNLLNAKCQELENKLSHFDQNIKHIMQSEKNSYRTKIKDTKVATSVFLNNNSQLQRIKAAFKNAIEKQLQGHECKELFERLVNEFRENFEETVTDVYEFGAKVLNLAEETLLHIHRGIKASYYDGINAAKEQCWMNPSMCKITNEYEKNILFLENTIAGLRGIARVQFKEVVSALKSEASYSIKEKIVNPLLKCVNK